MLSSIDIPGSGGWIHGVNEKVASMNNKNTNLCGHPFACRQPLELGGNNAASSLCSHILLDFSSTTPLFVHINISVTCTVLEMASFHVHKVHTIFFDLSCDSVPSQLFNKSAWHLQNKYSTGLDNVSVFTI